jgi:hypothetical protein
MASTATNPEVLLASGFGKMSCVVADIFKNSEIGYSTQAQSPRQTAQARRELLREIVFEASQDARAFSESKLLAVANDPAGYQYPVQIACTHKLARRARHA